MDKKLLQKYARVIAEVGAKINKGEEVWINAELDQPEFVAMVAEECYKLGAKKVVVKWSYGPMGKITYKYASVSALAKIPNYEIARYKYMVKNLPVMIHIISDGPNAMAGINQKKAATVRQKTYSKIKAFRDAMEDKYKWVIAAVPGKDWAKSVFPEMSEEDAIEALWAAILKTTRVDSETDAVQNWVDHNNFLFAQRAKLNDLQLRRLKYKSSNGTDFEVGLIEDSIWCGGSDETHDGRLYNPNMPTEEIFISPKAGDCSGTLVATKPLSYMGELIEDFSMTFKDGKVVSVSAKRNQKLLETMVSMDEGAGKLGEVALVPFNSPINETGILFYNTLFDENACCHFAIGAGFPMTIKGAKDLTLEQIRAKGINESMIHVDFMIGSSDLSIIGVKEDGSEVEIFKDGTWAI